MGSIPGILQDVFGQIEKDRDYYMQVQNMECIFLMMMVQTGNHFS